MTVLTRGGPHGIQVLSNHGEAEIGDTCMTGIIHKDIRLVECQYGGRIISRTVTYSLEVPVNHIARVEVTKSLSNIRQLATRMSVE